MSNLKLHPHSPLSRHSLGRAVRQHGISLVELMIGIAIGLLVVLAAVGTMSFTQASSSAINDSTRLQQTADMVFRAMGFQANQAGAITLLPAGDPSQVIFSSNFTGANPTTTGTNFLAVYGTDGAAIANSTLTQPDTLLLSYEREDNSRDCLGDNSNAVTRVDSTFSVANQTLSCLGMTPNSTAQPVAAGVEDMQIWYGIQTGTGAASQYNFLRASDMGTTWNLVQAIRICLVLRGERAGNPQPGLNQIGCQGQAIAADGFIRRVFWRTFTLRNKIL